MVPVVRLNKMTKTPPVSVERLHIKTKHGARSKRPSATKPTYTKKTDYTMREIEQYFSKKTVKDVNCEKKKTKQASPVQYFSKKTVKDVNYEKKKTKQASPARYARNQCPICNRSLQRKGYDDHMKLHYEDQMKFTCRERTCGAQFQHFSKMKLHFLNCHQKFIVLDSKSGYKVEASKGKEERGQNSSKVGARNGKTRCRVSETATQRSSNMISETEDASDEMNYTVNDDGDAQMNSFPTVHRQEYEPNFAPDYYTPPSTPNYRQYRNEMPADNVGVGFHGRSDGHLQLDMPLGRRSHTGIEERRILGMVYEETCPAVNNVPQINLQMEQGPVPGAQSSAATSIVPLIDVNILNRQSTAGASVEVPVLSHMQGFCLEDPNTNTRSDIRGRYP